MRQRMKSTYLGVLIFLCSSASMAATVTLVPSTYLPFVGEDFTLTIHADFGSIETAGATLGLSYSSNFSFVSAAVTGPVAAGGFIIMHPDAVNPTSFDILAPGGCCSGSFDAAILTFHVDVFGTGYVNINDDCDLSTYSSCDQYALQAWYDSTTYDAIPIDSYTQFTLSPTIPAPLWLFSSALGVLAWVRHRVLRA